MPFDLQPVLRGELVELRPLHADDFDALYVVASDPLIWEQHPESTRWREEVFRRFFDNGLASGGALVAMDAHDGRIIGSSRFLAYVPERSEIEIGFTFLARECWGGRYNGEMKRLMLQHAFRFVDRVVFVVGAENHRSRRAVEKIGGVLVAPRLNPNGHDRVVYEITAESFGAARR